MKALIRFVDKNNPGRCTMTLEVSVESGADIQYWINHYLKFANTPKYIMTCESVDIYEWERICD